MINGSRQRLTVSAIAVVILLAVVQGIVSSNTAHVAKATGADSWAYTAYLWFMRQLQSIGSLPFLLLATATASVAVFSWADHLARQWLSRWRTASFATFDSENRRLIAMSLMLIFATGFAASALWYGGEHYLAGLRRASSPSSIESTPPPPEPPKIRRYSDYERSLKLPVINEFRDLLEGPLQKIIDDGPRLVSGWWNAIKDAKNNPNYNEELNAFFEILNTSPDRIEMLRKKHHRHEEIYAVTAPSYWNGAVPKMNHFRVNYQVAANAMKPEAGAESLHVVMNPARASFEQGLQEFTAWRNATLGHLLDLERQITRSD